jgi:hypothetical protein
MNYKKGIAPIIIVGIVAAALLVGGAVFISTKNNKSSEENAVQTSFSGSGVFRDIFSKGDNITCNFSGSYEMSEYSGTVYVVNRGERLREDFIANVSGQGVVETSMIKEGNIIYVWSSTMSQGFKTTVSDNELFPESDGEDASFDYDQNVQYECRVWNLDESMFNVPSEIQFIDTSAFMNVSTDSSVSAEIDYCSYCTQVPAGPAREQCLAAYSCN